MKLFLMLVSALCICSSYAAETEVEEGVLVLTEDNFAENIAANDFILVEFYAPWCGHCKALAPEYAKAAQKLEEEGSSIKLGKVDATVHQKLGQTYGVRGYPTLKFFKGGNAKDYGGGRTADTIISWLKKKTGPAYTHIPSEDALNKFKEDNKVCVVAFIQDMEGDAMKQYSAAADSIDDIPFGVVSSAEVGKAVGEAGAIAVYKQFDEGVAMFEGDLAADKELVDFVKGNQLALLTEFTAESAPTIFGGDIQVHVLLFISSSALDAEAHKTSFTEAAKDFKGQVLFIYIDSDVEDNNRVMEFFGLKSEDVPTYRMIKMTDNMAKYKPDGPELDATSVVNFCKGVMSGVISRHLMSEDVPDDWDKESVAVLVGKNFKEVAFDETKKVFVEFYAPWCGHCKQLAPIWEKLGDKFSSDSDVIIAKMDATANEVEEFEISGFPTLKYFPSGSSEVVDYNGERTMEAMHQFVESNGTVGAGDDEEDFDEEELDEDDYDEELGDEDLDEADFPKDEL